MDIFLSIPFLIFMPLVVSMFLISPLFTRNEIVVRRFSKSVFGFHFLYTILMLIFFDPANPYVNQIHFFGLDFGFEESYTALVSCCVDDAKKILYIY